MKYEANIYQMTVEDHTFWVAESKSLKGCVGQGDTSEEAILELEQNEIEWIETAQELGIPVPVPTTKTPVSNSGKFALRLAPNVYEEANRFANELGISMNQYLCNAIISYNTETRYYLRKPIIAEYTSAKVVNFDLKAANRKTHKIDSIDELKEM